MRFAGAAIVVLAATSLAFAASADAATPRFKRCGAFGLKCARVAVPVDRTGAVPGQVSLFVKRLRAVSSALASEPLPLEARRASSSETNAAWPSLRCTMLGSIPSASSARTPPTPSSMYCASRVSSSPM